MSTDPVTGYMDAAGDWHYPVTHVPADRYRVVLSSLAERAEILNAIALFSGPGVVDTVTFFNDLINAIDERLGRIEKRLDEAKIPEAIIPDDETDRYFTLPMLGNEP
jgi:hypothetical protein